MKLKKLSGYVREMEFFDSTNHEGHAAKVYNNIEKTFDKDFKLLLVDVLNRKVMYCGREYYLTNAIQIYLDKIFDAIEHESFDTSILYEFA